MQVRAFFVFAAMLTTSAASFASEDYCGEIAGGELRFRYISTSESRTALEISVPLRDGQAKFHRLDVTVGEANETLKFTLEMEKSAGRAEGTVHLPRPHKIIHMEAIYHQDGCFKLLKATFVNGSRVADSAASN